MHDLCKCIYDNVRVHSGELRLTEAPSFLRPQGFAVRGGPLAAAGD